MNLLFATGNTGKLQEARQIFADTEWQLLSLDDCAQLTKLDQQDQVKETGDSYQENATIKARFFARRTGHLTIAEDSGLEIKALHGEPGLYSARWLAGSDAERNQAILGRLQGHNNREAKFVSTVVIYHPQSQQHLQNAEDSGFRQHAFSGQVKGEISHQIRGETGFGYDPIFIPQGHKQTWAELGPEVKNDHSHRYRALMKLRAYLESRG